MRIFCGGIATETNTFSPIPIGMNAFAQERLLHKNSPRTSETDLGTLPTAVRASTLIQNADVIFGLDTFAEPGAAVVRTTFESLRDELLADIKASLPLDMVLLNLHGGMVAEGYDDPEGDILTQIRCIVGENIVIGGLLDPHCHLTDAMTENANILVCFKENPHTDTVSRANDLIRLCIDLVNQKTQATMSVYDCGMVDVFQTNREPMQGLLKRIRAMEGRDGVLDISIVHGFRRADIPYMGTKVIVVTNGDPQIGEKLSKAIGDDLYAMRGNACQKGVHIDKALSLAIASEKRPILLADAADNPGGGGPGDSTFILHELLNAGCHNFTVGYLWDPIAVQFALEAGVGASLPMRIGGKACPLSGPPLDLDVTVMGILENAYQQLPDSHFPMGNCVWLQSDGELDIVLTNKRCQAYSPSLFEQFGIDLSQKQVIVAKSAQHYKAYFSDVMKSDIVVDGPGVCCNDISHLPFERIRRDIWPFNLRPSDG